MMQNHRRSLLMKRSNLFFGSLIAIVLITFSFAIFSQVALSADKKVVTKTQMPFGGKEDVTFANDLWKAMKGYENWLMKSDVRMGMSPHGDFIRLYYNIVNVNAKPYHVILKDNYGGDGVTLNMVSESPEKYLMAVTVMVQREKGYDSDNNDWFWVKYNADGTWKWLGVSQKAWIQDVSLATKRLKIMTTFSPTMVPNEITFFKSVGVTVQNVAVTSAVLNIETLSIRI
jgi:hypothetical protein